MRIWFPETWYTHAFLVPLHGCTIINMYCVVWASVPFVNHYKPHRLGTNKTSTNLRVVSFRLSTLLLFPTFTTHICISITGLHYICNERYLHHLISKPSRPRGKTLVEEHLAQPGPNNNIIYLFFVKRQSQKYRYTRTLPPMGFTPTTYYYQYESCIADPERHYLQP